MSRQRFDPGRSKLRPYRIFGLLLLAGLAGCTRQPPVDTAAEADRLYRRANDVVSHVVEGEYSYSYMQFYWKRAQGFVDWIENVYPDSPTGKALRQGELKIGPFDPVYYRERVLAKLEEKRVSAYDNLNCAIFLYERTGNRPDLHLAALERIIEFLCVQKRWTEAVDFRADTPAERAVVTATVVRVNARVGGNEELLRQVLAAAPVAERPALMALVGRGMAERGAVRTEITRFLDQNTGVEVRAAVLDGMVNREIAIRRNAALNRAPEAAYLNGESVRNPDVRDDVAAAAAELLPAGYPRAAAALARYRAALGERPPARADLATVSAYLDYLSRFDRADELEDPGLVALLPAADRRGFELALVRALARAGRTARADAALTSYRAAHTADADAAVSAYYLGLFESDVAPYTVREDTFAKVPLQDLNALAILIVDWSLSPNRSVRGAAPWDAVVFKFDPGFTNLPLPKSKEVQEAARKTSTI